MTYLQFSNLVVVSQKLTRHNTMHRRPPFCSVIGSLLEGTTAQAGQPSETSDGSKEIRDGLSLCLHIQSPESGAEGIVCGTRRSTMAKLHAWGCLHVLKRVCIR